MKNNIDNTLTIVLIIFLLVILFGGFGMMGFGGMGGMMGNWGFGYGIMPILGPIIMLLITIAIILFIVWVVKQLSHEERRKNGKRR